MTAEDLNSAVRIVRIPAQDHNDDWPEPLAEEAYHGLAGEIVRTIEPHSEADPAGILIQLLIAFGNVVGREPHFIVEADRHGVNGFVTLVGESSRGRKGSSWGHIRSLLEQVDEDWATNRIESGLSSGEGLIWAVRNPIIKRQKAKEGEGDADGYSESEVDSGVADKRLLVLESEFASTLRIMGRDGNTLSPVLRNAWDRGDLHSLTKNSPARATGAHISIVAHVSKAELRRYFDRTEIANGFGNRFLWVCVQRSKLLPEGGKLTPKDLEPYVAHLRRAVVFARNTGEMKRDDYARLVWIEVYPDLSESKPGLFGAITARAEAQVMRLATIYALLDMSPAIKNEHLLAALAVWEYAEASARFIFGDSLGDPVADEILRALRNNPSGLTRTNIRDLFGRNRYADSITRALELLVQYGLARAEKRQIDGSKKPTEWWFATTKGEEP